MIGPNLIHLKLPFTSVPTPGKKRAISNRKDPIKITQSNVEGELVNIIQESRNKFEGMLKATIVATMPTMKKIICLDAKWNGVP